MKQENESAAKAIQLHDSPYTHNAGIQFSRATLEAKSRILNPPLISYGSKDSSRTNQSRVDGREAAWRMGTFIKPAACDVSSQ
jgi:hypothetical protein